MRVTTVGTGTSTPTAARVNAGYFVDTAGAKILLDCGSAVVHRLATLGLDWFGLTHVALTHFHPDHTSDLATLIFAWRHGVLPPRSEPLDLIGPAGTTRLIDQIATLYGSTIRDPGFPLAIRELAPGEGVDLPDGTRLDAQKVPHTAESIAYSLAGGGRRVVYSGDTGFDPTFADWAQGCDVLLLECSLPDSMAVDTHLTPERCALVAERAQPRCLVLTHFYPPVEQIDVAAIVGARFGGNVVLAWDGWTTVIEDR